MNLDTHIAGAEKRLAEVERALTEFDFSAASSPQTFEGLSREHQHLSRMLATGLELRRVKKELEESRSLLETEADAEFRVVIESEIDALTSLLTKLDVAMKAEILPPHPDEDRNLIIEIRPAAGGDEAGLFAGDLYRMYLRFAEQKGWRSEVLELAETDLGGIKDVAFSLQGADVFRCMQYERGVHRVQRVPVTESGGRIHTSTVTVAVLPEAEEVDISISHEELRIDVFRSSGPGGQCVNTTDSAVRITHLPTGVCVVSQQEKSQHRNKEIAMRILRSRLLAQKRAEEAARSAAVRRQQVGTGDRSERIRTYNFPQNRITDHRFGITLHGLPGILDGNVAELVTQIASVDLERRLAMAEEDGN